MRKSLLRYMLVLCVLPLTLVFGAKAQTSQINIFLEDYGYTDISLSGLFDQTTLWIPFESNWQLDGDVQINIRYTASPLLNANRAIITVLINEEEVTTWRPLGDGEQHDFQFVVPIAMINQEDGGFNLGFSSYLKTSDDICENLNLPSQWLTIESDSRVDFLIDAVASVPLLENLPRVIASDGPITQLPPLIFVLPEGSDVLTRQVAAKVAAGIAKNMPYSQYPVEMVTPANLTTEQRQTANLIFVGLPAVTLPPELIEALPIPFADGSFVENEVPVTAAKAVIQILPSPYNSRNNVLVVSGSDADGLQLAGEIFGSSSAIIGLRGQAMVLDRVPVLMDEEAPSPWASNITSFQQLGQSDRNIFGLGNLRMFYVFRPPQGWLLEENSRLVLHLALSPALRALELPPMIFVNEIYVGSVEVPRDAADIWVPFDLPIRALNYQRGSERLRQLSIRVEFPGATFDSECEYIDTRNMWASLYSDSYLELPHGYVPTPDLQAFPYPFITDEYESSVVIAIPNAPTNAEISDALTLSAVLGQYAVRDFDLRIMTASEVTQENASNSHIIVLGTSERQSLLESLRGTSQVSIGEENLSEYIEESGQGVYAVDLSPWNPDRQVYYVFGYDQAAYDLAFRQMYIALPPVSNSGFLALVKGDFQTTMLDLRAASEPSVPPEVQATIEMRSLEATATAAALNPLLIQATPDPSLGGALITTSPVDGGIASDEELSNTERLILITTAFLVALVTLAALFRIMFGRNQE
jgi:hypothetical protein